MELGGWSMLQCEVQKGQRGTDRVWESDRKREWHFSCFLLFYRLALWSQLWNRPKMCGFITITAGLFGTRVISSPKFHWLHGERKKILTLEPAKEHTLWSMDRRTSSNCRFPSWRQPCRFPLPTCKEYKSETTYCTMAHIFCLLPLTNANIFSQAKLPW